MRLRRLVAPVLLGLSISHVDSAAAEGDGDSWRSAAESALMPALRHAYPGVTAWTINPLVGKRQHSKLQAAHDAQAIVAHLGKRSAMRVIWQQDAQQVTTTVWFSVDGIQSVATVKEDVKAGAALAPEGIQPADHDVLALACTPVVAPEALAGMRTRKSLRAGDPICTEAIEPRPAVSRGENVVVRSVAGAVTITARAVAQQDGRIGQVLRVKNPSSGEVYLASVTDNAEVVVHE